ncbi:hypothetical protein E1263_03760 [Kribbella antibiotica]|uniref:Uncharacterized protein n=1 Tax=Kribbella antibiotica TaxID=190195 RepID=A0A4R4ZTY3_9ACTN|nr:hypothetical protein [Kribbella antibiotica]TDD62563.1 hypothetical protein E1263_03760 [Kribbella antibiotica]
MNKHDEDYTGVLKVLQQAPDESIDSISIDRAIHNGRGRIRRRRVLGGLAVVGVVGAAAFAAPPLVDTFRDSPVAGQGPAQVQPFGVWGREFDIGTGGGFQAVSYTTASRFQVIGLTTAAEPSHDGPIGDVTLLAPGLRPKSTTGTKLPDIAGRPAVLVSSDDSGTKIVWQYADDAWGTVMLYNTPENPVERARQVAEGIHRRATPVPVKVPFTAPRRLLADDLDVVMVRFPFVTPDASQLIEVTLGKTEPDATTGPGVPRFGVLRPGKNWKGSTKVNGRPATVDDIGATISGLGSGFAATITADRLPKMVDVAAGITLISDPSDPTKGTDEPLR